MREKLLHLISMARVARGTSWVREETAEFSSKTLFLHGVDHLDLSMAMAHDFARSKQMILR